MPKNQHFLQHIRFFKEKICFFKEKISVFNRLLLKRGATETALAPGENLEQISEHMINDIEMGHRGAEISGGGQAFSAVSAKSRW